MTLLYFAASKWNGIKQREQQIMSQLKKEYNVVYVEQVSLFPIIPFIVSMTIPTRQEDGITILSIPSLAPFRINNIVSLLYAKYICILLQIKMPNITTIGTGHPSYWHMFNMINSETKYYDCMDNRQGLSKITQSPSILNRFFEPTPQTIGCWESTICSHSDHIFVSSPMLKNIDWIPDSATVIRNAAPNDIICHNSHAINHDKIMVGFVGVIDSWVDSKVFNELAERENVSVEIIGPIKDEQLIQTCNNFNNMRCYGEMSHSDAMNKLGDLDIGLIPFEINEITEFVDPIKMYEYLSKNCIVVSSSIPAVSVFDCKNIHTYNNVGNVYEKIEEINVDSVDNSEIMSENTWQERVKKISDTLSS